MRKTWFSLLFARANNVTSEQGGVVCLNRSAENQWQVGCMITRELLV